MWGEVGDAHRQFTTGTAVADPFGTGKLNTLSDIDDIDDSDKRNLMTAPVSLRLPEKLANKVRTIAALEHRSVADTVRILAEEAIKMREFPDIVFVEGPTGRRASFRQGPDVWEVLEPYVLAGGDWDTLRQSYLWLDERTLRTAVRYYESYPEEIDARIALNQRS